MTDTLQITKNIFSKRFWLLQKDFSHTKKVVQEENTWNNYEQTMEDLKNWVNTISLNDYLLKRWLIR